jgi:FlaA1/EpsC-like NDP-sugar epimerase
MLRARLLNLVGKLFLDAAALAAAFGLAFVLRFEQNIPPEFVTSLWQYLPWVVAVQLVALVAGGRLKATWRYTDLPEALRLGACLGAAAAVLFAWLLLHRLFLDQARQGPVLPYGVVLLDLVLTFLTLVSARATARLWSEHRERRRAGARAPWRLPTLLIGAGRAGMLAAREVHARPDSGIELCGFLDDDPGLHGMRVAGLPVLGGTADLRRVIDRHGIGQLIITIASGSGEAIGRIMRLCKATGLPTKIVPPVHELAEGRFNLARLREVSIEDLLRREPVHLDLTEFGHAVAGQTVLVTGAGGSIGSVLCHTLAGLRPGKLVLIDQAENSLFQAHWALAESFPGLNVVPQIADICDAGRVNSLLGEHRPAFIFHAAAHKHVPMLEWNPGEAVKNNVLGTRTVADLAAAHGVSWFVMISTDKAVNPTSVMGASKRVAELYVQALARQQRGPHFMTVRFGNVLGSAGSVIPIFQRQITAGGPVTVTHPEMRRYFMTIPEACQLVLKAAGMGKGGELFILDMGEPVKIVDLAGALIRLSGLTPGRDVKIHFTGLRPGEKLFEELALGEEAVDRTSHPRIYIGKVVGPDLATVGRQIDELGSLAAGSDAAAIRAKLKEIVPEYDYGGPRHHPAAEAAVGAGHHLRGLDANTAASVSEPAAASGGC